MMKRLIGIIGGVILICVFVSSITVLAQETWREKIRKKWEERRKQKTESSQLKRSRSGLEGESPKVPITWITKSGSYGPGNYGRRFQYGGQERFYEIHVPINYKSGIPMPVVLVLHGGGGNTSIMRDKTGMDDVSEQEGFIVAYPAGTNPKYTDRWLFWNAGRDREGVDDVGYFSKVLDDLPKYFSIDTKRIYATGISRGSRMCYRLASELSNRIAAIGAVSGQRSITESIKPPIEAISIIHFHGIKDTLAPFYGGQSKGLGRQQMILPSVEEIIQEWVKYNGCLPQPEVTRIGQARRLRYSGGRSNTEVVLWVLEDGGHTWPGGTVSRFEIRKGVGNINQDISASKVMWEFFKQHPKE
ncbi:MAG: hypothetical protein JSW40_09530 [Candidatus Omnitrophota bacterium]|nr:MAG: hypothetical protein JSW40_09530 [Candidatus Omnitrophota bacterium]